MRNVLFWGSSALLVVGALSATIALTTMNWLYPTSAAPAAGKAVVLSTPAARPAMVSAESTGAELAALAFLERVSAGDISGARAMAAGLSDATYEQTLQLKPVVQQAALLPVPAGAPDSVLVWTTYRRDGRTARGAYRVTLEAGKVIGATGPLAPEGGYGPLPWQPIDERGRKVSLEGYKGRGLVIIAPRLPEADLTAVLTRLQTEFSPMGVEVVLAVDLGGPDLTAHARNAGFAGPVWRIKGHLEEVPVLSKGRLLGAVGLLVDRVGTTVASLAALDPSRYGLDGQPIEAVAPAIFRAYGLTP